MDYTGNERANGTGIYEFKYNKRYTRMYVMHFIWLINNCAKKKNYYNLESIYRRF